MRHRSQKGTALVTGGAKRIGKEICLALGRMGYNVAVHYHSSRRQAEETAKQIRHNKVECEIFPCDLNRQQRTLSIIQSVYTRFPDLNVLVNSASIFKKSRLATTDLHLFQEHFATNFHAPYILICEFARLCRRGHIINLLDTDITRNKTEYFSYLLMKKALADLTKMAAVALSPQIRVNGICPGLILPPPGQGDEYLQRQAKNVPLQKKGEVDNITHSLRFLLGNDYVTGQFIFNDGGEHLV